MPRRAALFALAILEFAIAGPALAQPRITYLQNGLDLRGRCLAAEGDQVAMRACTRTPGQQWIATRGDLPGYYKLHTAAGGPGNCLASLPTRGAATVHMMACSSAKDQQWSLRTPARRMTISNRATGATRCLEATQTGFRLTPCSRRQAGHVWRSDEEPVM